MASVKERVAALRLEETPGNSLTCDMMQWASLQLLKTSSRLLTGLWRERLTGLSWTSAIVIDLSWLGGIHVQIVHYEFCLIRLSLCTQHLLDLCMRFWAFILSSLLGHRVVTKANHSTALWRGLISHLKASVVVKDRRIHLKSHGSCFVGSNAIDVVMDHLSHASGFEGIF